MKIRQKLYRRFYLLPLFCLRDVKYIPRERVVEIVWHDFFVAIAKRGFKITSHTLAKLLKLRNGSC